VDDSFLEDSICMSFVRVVRNHKGDWVADFFHCNEVGGDVFLGELCIIHIKIGLEFCRDKGYNNIVCVKNCFESKLLKCLTMDRQDNNLHIHATNILL
jgi:hypothetical protein